jgi:uncharacterized protein YraI
MQPGRYRVDTMGSLGFAGDTLEPLDIGWAGGMGTTYTNVIQDDTKPTFEPKVKSPTTGTEVPAAALALAGAPAIATATVVTKDAGPTGTLKLRATPGGTPIGGIPHGATVDVLSGDAGGWTAVRYNGTSGYASSQFLSITGRKTPGAVIPVPFGSSSFSPWILVGVAGVAGVAWFVFRKKRSA